MPLAAVAVHRDHPLDVAEEAGEGGRGLGTELHRRDVPAQVGGLADDVERRARGVGGGHGDVVGAAFEVAAVEGHDPEAAPELALLVDAGMGEQLREHPSGRAAPAGGDGDGGGGDDEGEDEPKRDGPRRR